MKSRFDTALGKRITEAIAARAFTQKRLALALGLPVSSLNQMLTGRMAAWPDLEERAMRVLRREK